MLPFCASSASRFESAVNRVPLNDPYLLRYMESLGDGQDGKAGEEARVPPDKRRNGREKNCRAYGSEPREPRADAAVKEWRNGKREATGKTRKDQRGREKEWSDRREEAEEGESEKQRDAEEREVCTREVFKRTREDQLDLPEDASPSLFGLPYYDVTIGPTPAAQIAALSAEREKGSAGREHSSAENTLSSLASDERDSLAPEPLAADGLHTQEGEDAGSGSAETTETARRRRAGRPRATDAFADAASKTFLKGWWVPAEDRKAQKAILCAHGWMANRQACLPFLGVAKKIGLQRDHSFLLFDMKNSGESSRAADCVSDEGTGCAAAASRGEAGGFCSDAFPVISSSDAGDALLGCQAAKDLVQALLWMKKTHNVSTVSIYAQGVSAMGTMLLVGQYRDRLESEFGITIDRIVFDSPVCNARDAVANQPLTACIAKSAKWLHDVLMWAVNQRRGQELRRMRASLLLPSLRPVKKLVLTSRDDELAPWETVEKEMMLLPEADRPEWTYVFPSGAHCDLIRTNPEAYSQVLRAFYSDPSFLGRLWAKIVGKRAPVSSLSGVQALGPHDFTLCAEREEREKEKREREKDKAHEAETRAQLGRKKLAIAAVASVIDALSYM
ncbi:hypothetical protein TGDOM2_358850 [Toxoplasma gondii GAB2-2007-GAL-DOM2]|uniref:Alpha/beta hydrolase family protein n=2 Tax=Toxoplasma gondii TaxID=5811 RepID=A0A086JKV1_TOXGO|nr:hypothetical protein TGDOM2_358850 [Toxoplasma gondii GAB2-2007-GAL-DOM2]KFG32769.1 hypothetical protein TGFOU_358850 [Toxoplasma gondii FOU]